MDKLYSLSRIIERVRTEQIDQTNFMGDVKQIWEENSNKTVIIKTLLENLNTITNSLYKSLDKNVDKIMNMDTPAGRNLKYQWNTVTIGSHYRRKCIEKEIWTSYNKFDRLDIDEVVVITNDINDNGIRVTTKN